jgi:hypothetical protein
MDFIMASVARSTHSSTPTLGSSTCGAGTRVTTEQYVRKSAIHSGRRRDVPRHVQKTLTALGCDDEEGDCRQAVALELPPEATRTICWDESCCSK